MSTSSPTTSASTITESVVIALGSNLGDRGWHLRRALHALGRVVRLVRVSSVHETEPVDAPGGSPDFLNMTVLGRTSLNPHDLLREMLAIEARLGRRRSVRNAPRVIDLDLIFYGGHHIRTPDLIVPHPRWMERDFVLEPLREINVHQDVYRVPYPPLREAGREACLTTDARARTG